MIEKYLSPEELEMAKRLASDRERRPGEVMFVILPAIEAMMASRLKVKTIWEFVMEDLPDLKGRYGYQSFFQWVRRNLKKKNPLDTGGLPRNSGKKTSGGIDVFEKIRENQGR